MKDELKKIADVFYLRIIGPASKININWIHRTMLEMKMTDENIDNLYMINAPLSREVWYYTFLKFYGEKKIHILLNRLGEVVGMPSWGNLKHEINALGLVYDGAFHLKAFSIVVLVSGRGTNLQALIDAIDKNELNAQISAVISNKQSYALKRAKERGIESLYLPAKHGESRQSYDRRLDNLISKYSPDLIVLAGFLRVLSPEFVERYRWKIINIHPSLLPAFGGLYGKAVHEAVLKYGCKVSGCTVHFVNEEVDAGPIIVQRCLDVRDDDTAETLANRILKEEHQALVSAVRLLSEGRVEILNGVTRIKSR